MLPDSKIKCHRTGFTKACRDMVAKHNCRAWVRLTGRDKDTDAPIDLYDCADHWGPQIQQQAIAQLSKQLDTVAESIDLLRKEVQQGNDVALANTLDRLNAKMDEARELTAAPHKLLES